VVAAARENLSDKETRQLEELITEYEDAFATKGSDYGRTHRVYHCIDGKARPI
jgi:hypothetical protein